MNEPGMRLRHLASRLCSTATMEYVIGPALADLQMECTDARAKERWRRTAICARAYLSFWAAVAAHSWESLMNSPAENPSEDPRAMSRMLLAGTAMAAVVAIVTVLVTPLTMTLSIERLRMAFGGNLSRAAALLVPSALPIALPSGVLFGTLWGIRQRPAGRSVQTIVLTFGICSSLLSAALMEWVIPDTNQAFRTAVFQSVDHQAAPPERGSNELTWRELGRRLERERLEGRLSQVRELRLSYHGRIAVAVAPLLFAMLGLALLRRDRSSLVTFASLGAYLSYYTVIGFNELVSEGTLSPVAVAWAPDIVALMILAVSARNRSIRPQMVPR